MGGVVSKMSPSTFASMGFIFPVKEVYNNGLSFQDKYANYEKHYHEMKHQVMELANKGCPINEHMKADIDTNVNELKSYLDRFEKIRDYVKKIVDKFNLNIGEDITIANNNHHTGKNNLCNHDEYTNELDQMEKSKKSASAFLSKSEAVVSMLKKKDVVSKMSPSQFTASGLIMPVKEIYNNGLSFQAKYAN